MFWGKLCIIYSYVWFKIVWLFLYYKMSEVDWKWYIFEVFFSFIKLWFKDEKYVLLGSFYDFFIWSLGSEFFEKDF